MAQLVALDLGSKRIGVAKSDGLGMYAHALPAVLVTSGKDWVKQLGAVFEEFHPAKVIVGHPKTLEGESGIQAKKIEEQVEVLRQSYSAITFELWDERLTSKEAEVYLRESGMSGSKRRQKIDSLSAQILLQHYLDHHRGSGRESCTDPHS